MCTFSPTQCGTGPFCFALKGKRLKVQLVLFFFLSLSSAWIETLLNSHHHPIFFFQLVYIKSPTCPHYYSIFIDVCERFVFIMGSMVSTFYFTVALSYFWFATYIVRICKNILDMTIFTTKRNYIWQWLREL